MAKKPASADERKLPFGSEFSPGTLEKSGTSKREALLACLQIVNENEGDREKITEAFRKRFFKDAAAKKASASDRLEQQLNRSNNVTIAMVHYGLVDGDSRTLTSLGRELLNTSDEDERFAKFATSILRDHHGLDLVNAVRTLRNRGVDPIRVDDVRDQLRRDGFTVPTHNGDASVLRMWLELSGVINAKWEIDDSRLAALLGEVPETLDEWTTLTKSQQGFIKTLQRVGRANGVRPIPSPELVQMVRAEHGQIFDEGRLAAKVYEPLVLSGWITREVSKDGRGGRGGLITPTEKTINLDLDLADTFKVDRLPPDLVAALRKAPAEVRRELLDDDKNVKGVALEVLAVNMASDLGLVPVGLRMRGVKTGGAEVDYVAEGAHLMYSRWIFQCKNTGRVDVSVLSKEIGMATLLQCSVIVIATTGSFSSTVKKYAEQVIKTTPFQVVLVDGSVVDNYAKGSDWNRAALREHFGSTAAAALTLKRPQLIEALDDLRDEDL